METSPSGTIVVTGATGLQGGAVARQLLRAGWRVRALTRRPGGRRAAALAALGAEVVRADMNAVASLLPAFAAARAVYSVQNPVTSGVEAEIRQGRNVADAALTAGVQHVVYGSAGTGEATGIPSWDSKLRVEEYMRRHQLPVTILRPMAFMELMTERKFFAAASTWHVMPALMGEERKVAWLSVDDLATIAAAVFAAPDTFIGSDLRLATDLQSIGECRAIYREVMAREPPRFRMPVPLFRRLGFVGSDLTAMWTWLRTAPLEVNVDTARAIHPEAVTVRSWLSRRRDERLRQPRQAGAGEARGGVATPEGLA